MQARLRSGNGILAVGMIGAAFGLVLLPPSNAQAQTVQCCSGYTQQCAGTKSMWCVANAAPAGTLPQAFCAYGDEVVSELEALFDIQAPQTFEFDVEWPPTGGAQTPTACGTFGNAVTGDAFTSVGEGNITGFWGYLLSLHEAINQWTGLTSGGWPTDYWADHVSAFPNEMDWRIMGTLGAKLNDANLTASSPVQKARFWPNGDSEDSRVQMFDGMFTLPAMGDGYDGFSRIFSYVQKDNVSWNDVATNGANPDERRSEYVAAYLSLGAGQSVLPIMQNPASGYNTGKSWPVCAGKWDGVSGDPGDPSASPATTAYTCSEANIDAIATAHCSIAAATAAGTDETADLKAFRAGNYAGVTAQGKCGAGCPTECGCKTSSDLCVAPWLADALADGGVGTPGNGGDDGGGTASGSSSGGGAAGSSSGSGATGGSSSGTLGGSSGGAAGSSSGTTGAGSSSGGGNNGAGSTNPTSPGSSGCGCTAIATRDEAGGSALLTFAAFVGLAFMRSRKRGRS